MADDTEYELNTLCQKLVFVLNSHKYLALGNSKSPLNKAFSTTFKKVKKQGYVKFNDFLSDIKHVFGNLKKDSFDEVDELEELFARELQCLINVDYYDKSGDDTDTSDSLPPPDTLERSKSGKKLKQLTPMKQEKIKIKLKLTPEKMTMPTFDYNDNVNKIQGLCTELLNAAILSSDVKDNFTYLPDKELFDDYYEIIQHPVSFSMIKEAISSGHYTSIYHCFSDLVILTINAKAYNEPHTPVHDQSVEITKAINKLLRSVSKARKMVITQVSPGYELADSEPSHTPCLPSDVCMDLWQMLNKVLAKCNKSGRPLANSFLRLPDRSKLPIYYKQIARPMSFCRIRSKLICGRYLELDQIVADLHLLCENAIKFNKKSSLIHKDATTLKDFIKSLAAEASVSPKKVSKAHTAEKKRSSQIITSPAEKKRTGSTITSPCSKPKVGEKKQKSLKTDSIASPETKTKIGQKRRANQISSKTPASQISSKTPADQISNKTPASQISPAITPTAPDITENEITPIICPSLDFVKKCFDNLKNCGPGLQSELTQCCNKVYKEVIDISEIAELLVEANNPRNVLLKIVCALMSRLDPLCMEYSSAENILVSLVNQDKDVTELIECLPVYTCHDEHYYIQEELMSLFRLTGYSKILSHNSNITRIAKSKSALIADIPSLDILSEDVVLVSVADVNRIVITPMTKLAKKVPSKPKTSNDTKTPSVTKTPKSESSKTPKPSKPPKVKQSEKRVKKEDSVEKPIVKKLCAEKDVSNDHKVAMKNFVNYIRNIKDINGDPLFEDFFEAPHSKTYHSIIKFPMCLDTVLEQIENGGLKSLGEVISACLLIVQNARYYNEETADVYKNALLLQHTILSKVDPGDTNETIVCASKIMLKLMTDLKDNTDVMVLTENTNSKFSSMSFKQLYEKVKTGYYTRLDSLQDDFLQMLLPLLSANLFGETAVRILSVFKYYLTVRDRTTQIKSRCFDLNMEKFLTHYQDRLETPITESSVPCLTYNNNTYIVGEKVLVKFSEDDVLALHINVISAPHWVAGTVYLMADDTIYKTDIKDVIHAKYITGKLPSRYKYMAYNYRTRTESDIINNNNRPVYSRTEFKSFYSLLSLSKYNCETILHGNNDHKTYYLQYVRDNGDVFKVGDFIYLRSDSDLPFIARIDKIHKDTNDEVYVFGPWFIRPSDTRYYDSKTFYPNEVVMSNITDANHINSVEGKCHILFSKDYTTKHPLGMLNKDVYVCDHKYDESNHKFSKLIKLYLNSNTGDTIQDEWYTYETPMMLSKVSKPLFTKPVQYDVDSDTSEEEDSSSEEEDRNGGKIPAKKEEPAKIQSSTPRTQDKPSQPDLYTRMNVHKAIAINNSLINASPGYTPYKNVLQQQNSTDAFAFTPTHHSPAATPYTSIRHTPVATPYTHTPNRNPVATPKRNTTGRNTTQHGFTPMSNSAALNGGTVSGGCTMKCQWGKCGASFSDPNEFYVHVINTQTHLSPLSNVYWKCCWKSCTDQQAKTEGCQTQILLRRHLLEHMKQAGYSPSAPAQTVKILRHSEAYKNFLKKLVIQAQVSGDIPLED